MIASDAETLGKRRLSADPRKERNVNGNSNANESIGNYTSSKTMTNSSKQGTAKTKFTDKNKVYSSV